MSSTIDDLKAAYEDLGRLIGQYEQSDTHGKNLDERIVDAMNGHPRAVSYEPMGATDEVWCWVHERDVRRCHRNELDCRGERITGPADPTGEAALRADKAAEDRKEMEDGAKAVRKRLDAMVLRARRYTPRPATDKERREVDGANDPGCVECARTDSAPGIARWEPRHKGLNVCQWHYRWECDTGRAATVAETMAHHSGQRVKRPA